MVSSLEPQFLIMNSDLKRSTFLAFYSDNTRWLFEGGDCGQHCLSKAVRTQCFKAIRDFHTVHTALILLAALDSQTTSPPPIPTLSWCTTWYWRRGKEHDGGLLCKCCGSILSTWFSIAWNSLSSITIFKINGNYSLTQG